MADFISISKSLSTRISSIDTIEVVGNLVRLHTGARSYDLNMQNGGETTEIVAARLAKAQKDPRVTLTVQDIFASELLDSDLIAG
jgi:hypothetical protein